jgi:hypothetical protein
LTMRSLWQYTQFIALELMELMQYSNHALADQCPFYLLSKDIVASGLKIRKKKLKRSLRILKDRFGYLYPNESE